MSNAQRIHDARSDMTDFVVHLTRRFVAPPSDIPFYRKPFDRLKDILKSGVLTPTFAWRVTYQNLRVRTIKGNDSVVCFTEQPLEQIPVTLRKVAGDSFCGYGIALHKVDLYRYGGRPAIPGDDTDLAGLGQDQKYRWVRYRPTRPSDDEYPSDFSWEREWRCRKHRDLPTPWKHALIGVPLLLPEDFRRIAFKSSKFGWIFSKRPPEFRIIVAKDAEAPELREYIEGLKDVLYHRSLYHKMFWLAARKAQIISLQHVERRLRIGDERYRKIETLSPPRKRPDVVPIKKIAVAG